MWLERQVVMLPMEKVMCHISKGDGAGVLNYHILFRGVEGIYVNHTYQHLYFLSDEKIKKGQKFLCVKDFIMKSGERRFTKGKIYLSEVDGCLTNDNGNENHMMSLNHRDFAPHFKEYKPMPDLGIRVSKNKKLFRRWVLGFIILADGLIRVLSFGTLCTNWSVNFISKGL